ncbi:hypothetical protein JS533_003165 [Bifidobacterium amazonense]|uniref:Transposase n=1 Tax=Bifidobacterium amazonense TaxID=2809027 RepID=A0ABS9VT82_9BIFI|nr:hypothetical protein [Bifidobacterium amazonense]MCH9275278.1 hypothetical protein [Bifidobacterium amazonense]
MDTVSDDMTRLDFAETWLLAERPSSNGAYEPWRDERSGARIGHDRNYDRRRA